MPTEDIPENNPIVTQAVRTPRITIVQSVYHQIPGQSTAGPEPTRFYRWLESDEEAYQRNVKISTTWQSIDVGWLKDKKCSYILISNNYRTAPTRTPTQAEIDANNAKVLEIGIEDVDKGEVTIFNEIPVGEDMRIPNPKILEFMRIRCKTEDTKYSIYLVPA